MMCNCIVMDITQFIAIIASVSDVVVVMVTMTCAYDVIKCGVVSKQIIGNRLKMVVTPYG